jgi:hypothetical protein
LERVKSVGFAPAMRAKISRPIASTSDCISHFRFAAFPPWPNIT